MAGLDGGWAFQADERLSKQRQAAVGSEIQESLSKLKGQRHEEANANFQSTYWLGGGARLQLLRLAFSLTTVLRCLLC